jgi:Spy/CpxP family protein refolding chaperone
MKTHAAFAVLALLVTATSAAAQVKPIPAPGRKTPGSEPLIVIDGVVQPDPRKLPRDRIDELRAQRNQDPFAGVFFPPEMVMQNQQMLGLTQDQRSAIVTEMVRSQQRFVELQWQMQTESESLRSLMKGARMDEQRVMQQLDRVLDTERQIKRTQIELQIRILNTLTEQQQNQLRQQRANNIYEPKRYDLGDVNYSIPDRR